METNEQCPWNTNPLTLGEMIISIAAQRQWETINHRKAPLHWNMVLTKEVFEDLVKRVVDLERRIDGRP